MTDLAIAEADSTPLRARVGAKFAYGTSGVSRALLSFAVSGAHDIREESILVHAAGRLVEPREIPGATARGCTSSTTSATVGWR